MKTERRHKLETNELADSLSHWIDRTRPYLRTVAGLIIALAVFSMAYAVISRQAAAKAREGWNEYFAALNSFDREKLDDVADKFPGTPVAWWASTVVGDLDLDVGSSLLFTDKAAGRDKLHSAAERYEEVRKQASEATVLQRATFGAARAYESLGDLKAATDAYQSLARKWPGCALAQVATQRAKDLERQDTKEFYDWFDKQNPGKSMAHEPGKPGEKPAFDLGTVDLPPTKPDSPSSILQSDGLQLPAAQQPAPPTEDEPAQESSPDKSSSDDPLP